MLILDEEKKENLSSNVFYFDTINCATVVSLHMKGTIGDTFFDSNEITIVAKRRRVIGVKVGQGINDSVVNCTYSKLQTLLLKIRQSDVVKY